MLLKFFDNRPSLIRLLVQDDGDQSKLGQKARDGFLYSVIMSVHDEHKLAAFWQPHGLGDS